LFMVNVASQLQADGRQHDPAYSVLDLKADCRGYKYVEETIHYQTLFQREDFQLTY